MFVFINGQKAFLKTKYCYTMYITGQCLSTRLAETSSWIFIAFLNIVEDFELIKKAFMWKLVVGV